MTYIVLGSGDLRSARPTQVRRLVAPLLPKPPNMEVRQVGHGRNAYTLAVLPKGWSAAMVWNPEEVLVATRLPKILMNYFETWTQTRREDEYLLDRAYMHVHIALKEGPKQILALHCDPSMKKSDWNYRYKRGPHLHVYGADPDIRRAHISVCLRDSTFGGSDLPELTGGLEDAVKMIANEVLPTWERAVS